MNIYLKDNLEDGSSKIISAKKGIVKKIGNKFYLELYNGNIVEKNQNGINILSYNTTQINLSEYSTKTTVHPKIQELSSLLLYKCIMSIKRDNLSFIHKNLNCSKESFKNVTEELYKRAIVPFYILILAMIGASLTLRTESDDKFFNYKIFLFIIGIVCIVLSQNERNVTFLVLAQILSQYIGNLEVMNFFAIFFPFFLFLIIYFFLQLKFDH